MSAISSSLNNKIDVKEKLKSVRELKEPYNTIAKILAVACALFIIISGIRGSIYPYLHRAIFLGFILIIIFLKYPARKSKIDSNVPTLFDFVLIFMTIFSVSYVWLNVNRILWRSPFIDPILTLDVVMGVSLIFCVLEACRRVLGWILVIICLTFLAYALWGRELPGILSHAGVSPRRLIEYLILMYDGVFSSITGIGATFLFTFITFGTLLSATGIGDMIFNISKAITKNSLGAPAKIAVISSGLMASISGSSLANIVTTGSITIPMMKRVGIRPHEAGAFETAASVGGQITPPIMGAGVFVMAELTGIPLIRLLGLAVLPALLYYLSVYVFVYNRINLRSVTGEIVHKKENLPSVIDELKDKGTLLLALGFLIFMMLRGYSPYYSSSLSVVVLIAISFLKKSTRLTPKQIINALEKSTINALTVSAILATAAIVVGVMFQTGFVVNASSAVIRLSQGILPIAILLTILMSYVIGMCLPITVAYILISILGVPAFAEMGVPIIAAHMAIFWFSQDSTITPPVCMTAFVAADIAEAPRYKTGFTTLLFAKGLYIIPFMMIYTELLTGDFIQRLSVAIVIGMGLIAFAIALDGFWKRSFINIYGRLLALIAAIVFFYTASFDILSGKGLPGLILGLVILVGFGFIDKISFLQRHNVINKPSGA